MSLTVFTSYKQTKKKRISKREKKNKHVSGNLPACQILIQHFEHFESFKNGRTIDGIELRTQNADLEKLIGTRRGSHHFELLIIVSKHENRIINTWQNKSNKKVPKAYGADALERSIGFSRVIISTNTIPKLYTSAFSSYLLKLSKKQNAVPDFSKNSSTFLPTSLLETSIHLFHKW